jgi:hypothetical protein
MRAERTFEEQWRLSVGLVRRARLGSDRDCCQPAGQVVVLISSLVDVVRSQMCCTVHRLGGLGLPWTRSLGRSAKSEECSRNVNGSLHLGVGDVFAFRNISSTMYISVFFVGGVQTCRVQTTLPHTTRTHGRGRISSTSQQSRPAATEIPWYGTMVPVLEGHLVPCSLWIRASRTATSASSNILDLAKIQPPHQRLDV